MQNHYSLVRDKISLAARVAMALCLCLQTLVAEASWRIPTANYSRRTYGGGTQNWDIATDGNGWLYFANNQGVLEYDGSRWTLTALGRYGSARSVLATSDGSILCGGHDEFGIMRRDDTGRLSYSPLSPKSSSTPFLTDEFWNVEIDGSTAYFIGRNSIGIVDLGTDSLIALVPHKTISASARSGERIYLSIENELCTLEPDGSAQAVCSTEALGTVRALCASPDGTLLIGCAMGLWAYADGELRQFVTEVDDEIRRDAIFSLASNERHIAIGTVAGGAIIINHEGTSAQRVSSSNGLQNTTVLSISFDKVGDLWCGLDHGIDRVVTESPLRHLWGERDGYGTGYSAIVWGDWLYLGTNRGLYRTPYPIDENARETHIEFVEGSVGQVWHLGLVGRSLLCCHDKGLFQVTEAGKLTLLDNSSGYWGTRIFHLNKNIAVAGCYDGIRVVRHTSKGVTVSKPVAGSPNQVRLFEIDNMNRIWIAASDEVMRLTMSNDMQSCTATTILRDTEGSHSKFDIVKLDGHIVISSGDSTIICDGSNELTTSDGLLSACDGKDVRYRYLTRDGDGNLWYATGDRLKFREFDRSTMQFAPESETVISLRQFYVDGFTFIMPLDERRALVNCVQGFALADENKNNKTAKVSGAVPYIRRIECISPDEQGTVYSIAKEEEEPHITLPYERNSIRIEYGIEPAYNKMSQLSIALCREGEEAAEPSEWSEQSAKEFTFLSPGSYTFCVKALLANRQESAPRRIRITVLPPWYRTIWARSTYALLAALAVAAISHATWLQVQRSKKRMVQTQQEQMREQAVAFEQERLRREGEILLLQKEKVENELKSKSQELSTFMLNTLSRNELITKTKREIARTQEDLRNGDMPNALKRLNTLQAHLTKDADERINWERFEENFNDVNEDFMLKLQNRFPWITANEKRLCVYITQGLMSKEIAPLMNISVRGVEMLRYRLRKKMELSREDDLEELLRWVGSESDNAKRPEQR